MSGDAEKMCSRNRDGKEETKVGLLMAVSALGAGLSVLSLPAAGTTITWTNTVSGYWANAGEEIRDMSHLGLSAQIDNIKLDKNLAKLQTEFIADLRTNPDKEIIGRVYKYEDVGKHRTWHDDRAKANPPETRATFAFAMAKRNTGQPTRWG